MSYWSEKKVFVTGGSGFLGTHIVNVLNKSGAKVFSPRSKEYDLTDMKQVLDAFDTFNPNVVIHAAADVGGIGYNRISPADIFRNNLSMAVNILDACQKNNIEKVTLIGSACAYPGEVSGYMQEKDFQSGPMHESVEVYGLSKRALYLGSKAYKKQYGLKSIFLILTNLYGPYDKYDEKESHVVAALVRKFVEATESNSPFVKCWGTGNPVREFMYAEDCANAIIRSAEVYEGDDPLNIGTGIGTTIKELAETLQEVTGFQGKIIWDSSMPDGAMYKVLDTSRMKKYLGAINITSLKDGLQKTVEWYRSVEPEILK